MHLLHEWLYKSGLLRIREIVESFTNNVENARGEKIFRYLFDHLEDRTLKYVFSQLSKVQIVEINFQFKLRNDFLDDTDIEELLHNSINISYR